MTWNEFDITLAEFVKELEVIGGFRDIEYELPRGKGLADPLFSMLFLTPAHFDGYRFAVPIVEARDWAALGVDNLCIVAPTDDDTELLMLLEPENLYRFLFFQALHRLTEIPEAADYGHDISSGLKTPGLADQKGVE